MMMTTMRHEDIRLSASPASRGSDHFPPFFCVWFVFEAMCTASLLLHCEARIISLVSSVCGLFSRQGAQSHFLCFARLGSLLSLLLCGPP